MKNYLSDRKQYVKYNVHESDVMAIKTGVPQGSILGPLLFSICINDLVTVSNKLNFLMYADDTTIYFNLEDFSRDDVVNCVSIELNKVNNWLHENKLSLNIEKTKCMIFHRHQKKIEPMSFPINECYVWYSLLNISCTVSVNLYSIVVHVFYFRMYTAGNACRC